MTNIFLSHASEDKETLADELAFILNEKHTVWYDRYRISGGDSLRRSIDRGLRACDFGVVILSPNFFRKSWTNAEVDALFALEDLTRKIIIPVWFNLDFEAVKNHSPLLASRYGIDGSQEPRKIADAIEVAMAVSARTQEVVAPKPGRLALNRLLQTISNKELNRKILMSKEGPLLFRKVVRAISERLEAELLSSNTDSLKRFVLDTQSAEKSGPIFSGPAGVWLHLFPRCPHDYDTEHAKLVAMFYTTKIGYSMERDVDLGRLEWTPHCETEETLVWKCESLPQVAVDADEVISQILERYAQIIFDRIGESTS
jgi:hypothetical protein